MSRRCAGAAGVVMALGLTSLSLAGIPLVPGDGMVSDNQLNLEPLDLTLSVNKQQYVPGEALDIYVTAFNRNATDLTLSFSSSIQAVYAVDECYSLPEIGLTVLTEATVPANGSKTWGLRYQWQEHPLDLGWHSITGGLVGYGSAEPVQIRVVEPTLPTKSFAVDFDTVPGTGDSLWSLEEYWPSGVHFRSIGGGLGLTRDCDSGYVWAGSCTYPTGFNIVADLDVAVYGVTVDVSTATGRSVTLLARDAEGHLIGSVTSDSIQAYRQFLPLSLRTDQPIASLEWWSSTSNSTVLIDNLYLSLDAQDQSVPEPSLLAIPVAALLLGRARLRKNRHE